MVSKVKAAAKSTTLKVIVTALVAILPATYSYCQSVYETRQKYKQSHSESAAGYEQLAKSVVELQASMKTQHEQIVRLQIYMEALESFFKNREPLRLRGSAASMLTEPDVARPAPPAPPALEPPPAELTDVTAKN